MKPRTTTWMLIFAAQIAHADPISDFADAKARWASASITDYTFTYTDRSDMLVAPKCNVDVVRTQVKNGGSTRSVVLRGLGECPTGFVLPASRRRNIPRTVDAAFSKVSEFLRLSPDAARIEVSYDPIYGFPSHAFAAKSVSDIDERFEISDFAPTR